MDGYMSTLLFALLVSGPRVQTFTTTDVGNIHTAILTGYNSEVRPSEQTDVSVRFNLKTINDLNIRSQSLSTSGWFTLVWSDRRLIWLPENYDYIEGIYTTESKIWTPDIVVDNVVTTISSIGGPSLPIYVQYDGVVSWDPPGMYQTHCDIDVTYFPFDKQECILNITSWAYDIASVNLLQIIPKINLDIFHSNGEWTVLSTFTKTTELIEDGDKYAMLEFGLILKRNHRYYLQSVIFPVILISILTMVVFLLPVDSGEKMAFGLTVLLSLAVILTLISDKLPTTAVHTSILGAYLTTTLALSTISIILSVLILRLHYHVPKKLVVPLVGRTNASTSHVEEGKQSKTSELENEKCHDQATRAWSEENQRIRKNEFNYKWIEIAVRLDRLSFICFFILTVILVSVFLIVLSVGAS